jgi:hypothetical protein
MRLYATENYQRERRELVIYVPDPGGKDASIEMYVGEVLKVKLSLIS